MSHLNNPVGLLNDKARTAESAQKEDEEYDTMIEKIITKITASDGEIAAISQYADQMMGSFETTAEAFKEMNTNESKIIEKLEKSIEKRETLAQRLNLAFNLRMRLQQGYENTDEVKAILEQEKVKLTEKRKQLAKAGVEVTKVKAKYENLMKLRKECRHYRKLEGQREFVFKIPYKK